MKEPPAALHGALALISAGASIIPCGRDKKPLLPWGANHSKDASVVRRWWKRWGDAIPGVVTGSASNVWIVDLDVDKRTGEPAGEASAADLGIFPDEHPYAIRTPSGGWHLPYRYRPGLPRNTAGRLRCIDTRGDGGYVIAWDADRLAAAISDPDLPAPPAALIAALSRPEPAPIPPSEPQHFRDRYIQAAIENECRTVALAREGTRNNSLNRAAFALGQLVGAGALARQDAEASLLAAARACGLDSAEARATIASGLRAGMANPRRAPAPRQHRSAPSMARNDPADEPTEGAGEQQPDPLARLLDPLVDDPGTIPRRQWVGGHGALPRGRLTAIAGPPGVSKTTAALGIASALAIGIAYGPVAEGPPQRVLVACIEDDIDEIRRRIHAWADRFAPFPETKSMLNRNLSIMDLSECVPLFEVDIDGTMRLTKGAIELEEIISYIKPDAVIIDPLIEIHTADENKNHLLRPVLRHLRYWAVTHNAAVVIVHHETKSGDGTALQRLRGAGVIGGAIRSLLSLRHMSEEEADKYGIPKDWTDLYVRIETGKQQYARRSPDRWLTIEEYELSNGDKAPVLVPWSPPSTVITPEMLVSALRAVDEGWEGEPLSQGSKSRSYYRIAFEKVGVPRILANEVLNKLMRDGSVWIAEWHDPVTRKTRMRLRSERCDLPGWREPSAGPEGAP